MKKSEKLKVFILISFLFFVASFTIRTFNVSSDSVNGTATSTTPVVFGAYSYYSDLGSNGAWARVLVKTSDGTQITSLIIDQGKYATCTACSPQYIVYVSHVAAITDGTIVGTDLVITSPPPSAA